MATNSRKDFALRLVGPLAMILALGGCAGFCERVDKLFEPSQTDRAIILGNTLQNAGEAFPGPVGDAMEYIGWGIAGAGALAAGIYRRKMKRGEIAACTKIEEKASG